jgi:FixJ family two-component response regulator
VDALVTDVVLGGRSGVDLSHALLARHPGLAVVLISGDVRHHELDGLPKHTRCLQKPFSIAVLVQEVRAALASRS